MDTEPQPPSISPVGLPPSAFQVTPETTMDDLNAHHFPDGNRTKEFTFEVPYLILSEENGIRQSREGGMQQVTHEIEEWFSDVEEKDYPLGIQKMSMAKVGGRSIPVLDANSKPTAAEYLENVGKRTLWSFASTPIPHKQGQLTFVMEKQIFRNRRVWIVLP